MNTLAKTEQKSMETGLISVIERIASSPDADVGKLERMLDMQERVMNREAETAFNAAMAEMQSELPVIRKSKKAHNTSYAPFEHINEAVKPIMQKHGFAMSFRTDVRESHLIVTGILSHRAGHREQTSLPLPFDTSGSKNNVQAVGSSVSYGKRYVMSAMLNITTADEDDDGVGAGSGLATDEQLANMEALIDEVNADRGRFMKALGVETLDRLTEAKFTKGIAMLERKRAAK